MDLVVRVEVTNPSIQQRVMTCIRTAAVLVAVLASVRAPFGPMRKVIWDISADAMMDAWRWLEQKQRRVEKLP